MNGRVLFQDTDEESQGQNPESDEPGSNDDDGLLDDMTSSSDDESKSSSDDEGPEVFSDDKPVASFPLSDLKF